MSLQGFEKLWAQARRVRLPSSAGPREYVGPLPPQFWSLFWNHPDPSSLALPAAAFDAATHPGPHQERSRPPLSSLIVNTQQFLLHGGALADWSDVRDESTRACWPVVAAAAPDSGVLMGGTALAMYLRHRRSRDLDLFVYESLEPESVLKSLQIEAAIVVDDIAEGTLNCRVNGVKVQFLHARDQRQLDRPNTVEGLAIGAVRDITATKDKVIGDRGGDARLLRPHAHRDRRRH